MKKTMLTLMALALILTACASTQSASGTPAVTAQGLLPASTQRILGIFRLEGTEGAVTAEQAAALLPLWQVYRELDGSGTAAQEEIDALVGQIREMMTEGQMASIEAMSLTQADVMAVMSEQELVAASPQASSSGTTATSGPQAGPGGEMPPGDMGGDPAMIGAAAPVSTSGSSSEPAQSQGEPDPSVPSALLDALIELLQTRAA